MRFFLAPIFQIVLNYRKLNRARSINFDRTNGEIHSVNLLKIILSLNQIETMFFLDEILGVGFQNYTILTPLYKITMLSSCGVIYIL